MTIRRCRPQDHDPDRSEDEQVWCLYTKDGDRLLGRHPTKEKAERQERAIQVNKHSFLLTIADTLTQVVQYDHLPMGNSEPVPQALQDRFGSEFVYETEIAYVSAVEEDTIIGACNYKYYPKEDILSIHQVKVDSTYRRQGIAMKLIAEALRRHDPALVRYPYDSSEGKELALEAARKYKTYDFDIVDVDDSDIDSAYI